MPNTTALRLIALFVLLPSTLGADFWSLLGAGFAADALRRGQHLLAATLLVAAMTAGWLGLVTLWRLHYRLLRKDLSFNRRVAWLGLACGVAASVGLMAVSSATPLMRALLFGWPLLAAAFFSTVLWRLPAAGVPQR